MTMLWYDRGSNHWDSHLLNRESARLVWAFIVVVGEFNVSRSYRIFGVWTICQTLPSSRKIRATLFQTRVRPGLNPDSEEQSDFPFASGPIAVATRFETQDCSGYTKWWCDQESGRHNPGRWTLLCWGEVLTLASATLNHGATREQNSCSNLYQ